MSYNVTCWILTFFKCPPDETEPRTTLNILSKHLGLPPSTLRFQMCRFMNKHRQYTKTIAEHILHHKKQEFDDYLVCMEQDAPLDEIAIVVIACMFHFHTCILTETKFWTINREHKIGMCSLLLGLTGNLEFVPLPSLYYTDWTYYWKWKPTGWC